MLKSLHEDLKFQNKVACMYNIKMKHKYILKIKTFLNLNAH